MRIIKKIIRNLHRYIFTAFISVVFWAWIFTFVTDAQRAKKVTLFVNAPKADCLALEEALDADKPAGIRMVKVHPFEYAAFLTVEVDNADMYIIAESDIGKNLERLCPIPADYAAAAGAFVYESGGVLWALRVYDAQTDTGCARSFIDYIPTAESGLPAESYYLCFSASSVHLGEWNDSADDAAVSVAGKLLLLK